MEERDGSKYCKVCTHEYRDHHNSKHREAIEEVQKVVKFDKEQMLRQLEQENNSNLKVVEQLQAQYQHRMLCAKEKQKTACKVAQKQITVAAELLERKKMEKLGFTENLEYTTLDEVYIKKQSTKFVAYQRGEIPQEIQPQNDDEFCKQLLCNYAQQDAVESIDKLIKVHKYNPNYIPPNIGKCPIHVAAEVGNLEAIYSRERLVNEHKCLTKVKKLDQMFQDLKLSIDQIIKQEIQDQFQNGDLTNIIKNGQMNQKELTKAVFQKVQHAIKNISNQVNKQQKNQANKCKEMVSDIFQFGENPQELQQILPQKIQKQIKLCRLEAIKYINQTKIQTVEDHQKYLEQLEYKLRKSLNRKLDSTLLINLDFTEQQIKQLEQLDTKNEKNQQKLRKKFFVGRTLESNQFSDQFISKTMSVSSESRVIDHLFYNDKDLQYTTICSKYNQYQMFSPFYYIMSQHLLFQELIQFWHIAGVSLKKQIKLVKNSFQISSANQDLLFKNYIK
ncbi:hypothetical protein ABPG72_004820 [Tetrahymena utriculariae]